MGVSSARLLLHVGLLLAVAGLAPSQAPTLWQARLGRGVAFDHPSAFPHPNTDFKACGRAVPGNICDPDGVLSDKSKDYIAGVAQAILEGDDPFVPGDCAGKPAGYQVAVAVMQRMEVPPGFTSTQAANDFAKTLLASWGVGDAACKNGVVLLLSVDDRQVDIVAGNGTKGTLSSERVMDIIAGMRPALLRGDYDGAVDRAVVDIGLALAGGQPAGPQPSSAPSPAPQASDASTASSSSIPIGAIAGGVVAAVLALLAVIALRPGKGLLRTSPSHQPLPAELNSSSSGDPEQPNGLTDSFVEGMPRDGIPTAAPDRPAVFPAEFDPPEAFPSTIPPLRPDAPLLLHSPTPPSQLDAAAGRNQSAVLSALPPSYVSSAVSAPTMSTVGAALFSAGGIDETPTSSSQRSHAPTSTTPTGSAALEGVAGSVRQWAVEWSDVQLGRLVGRGSFGWVYLAHWKHTPVAVKLLNGADGELGASAAELPPHLLAELQAEADVMCILRHPNICAFYGICAQPPCLVTEFCSKGSLYDVLRAAAQQPESAAELSWRVRLGMALDAARGLAYLHSHSPPIIHRDIKSPNLLIDYGWRCKVVDFNLSKILATAPAANSSERGANNPTWLAPEVLRGSRHTAASDVYSFGLVLWELLTWRLPWFGAGLNFYQVAQQVMRGERPGVPPRHELPGPGAADSAGFDEYCALMRECWAHDPSERPGFNAIVPRLVALAAH